MKILIPDYSNDKTIKELDERLKGIEDGVLSEYTITELANPNTAFNAIRRIRNLQEPILKIKTEYLSSRSVTTYKILENEDGK